MTPVLTRVLPLLFATLLPPLAVGAPEIEPGRYIRVTPSAAFAPGGKETGELQLLRPMHGRTEFRLNVTMNPDAKDDGFLTRSGVIGESDLLLEGDALVYRSSAGEPRLGTCVVAIRRVGPTRVGVAQSGKCWWFGHGVDASGVYRRANPGEVYVVR